MMRSKAFREAFGVPYDSEASWRFDDGLFVSRYTAEDPSEDFAETFMCFLRHRGQLPGHLRTPTIRAKWRFVERLGRGG